MRKVFLGAAAALAVVAPGVASAGTSGHVGVGYGSLDDDDDSTKDAVIGIDGAFATNFGGNWNFQFDAASSDMDHDDHSHTNSAFDAHVFMRNEDWAVGGFVGHANIESDSFYGLGVSGAFYLDRLTLAAAASWAQATYDDPDDITNVTGRGSYFITHNFAVTGEAGYIDSEWEGEDGVIYGLNGEYQFGGSPFSVYVGYQRVDADYDGGGEHEADSFLIGGRVNFGTDNLLERDRSGASMIGLARVARDHALLY